jgi:nucleoside-diphosphate-sugar epimerase
MKILVTGATGFVGSHLTESLVQRGYTVKALARRSSNTTALEKLGVEIAYGDITDAASVEQAAQGCQQIYHLAAKMLEPGTPRKVYYATNVEGSQNVAQAALKAGVERLVYASSAGVYGVIRHPPVNENTALNPSSGYRETKFLGEQAVRSLHQSHQLPVVIVRLPGVYGPGSLSILGLTQVVASKNFRMIGTGNNHDHLAYVSDIVEGLRLCGETPGIEGECYLMGDRQAATVRQIVDLIAQELGNDRPYGSLPIAPYRAFNALAEFTYKRFNYDLPRIHRYALFLADKVLDISKAQTQLGYNPQVPVTVGVPKTVQWFREKRYI